MSIWSVIYWDLYLDIRIARKMFEITIITDNIFNFAALYTVYKF